MKSASFALALFAFLFSAPAEPSFGANDESNMLFETIAQMDAKLFAAFNAHDTDKVMSFFTADLEFYHDKGGLSGYEETREDFRRLFHNSPDIRRELVADSSEVYPIKDYGAIQVGVHRFAHTENGKEETGSFKFVHVWRKSGDSWKIARVVSYGH
jgi:ketosteroid isomerase-like protein